MQIDEFLQYAITSGGSVLAAFWAMRREVSVHTENLRAMELRLTNVEKRADTHERYDSRLTVIETRLEYIIKVLDKPVTNG